MISLARLWGVALITVAGCSAALAVAPVTYSRNIAPILRERCEECHHQGTAAPMALTTYQETRPWAKSIRERVIKRQMPPWHIDQTVGIQHFQNDRSLSADQIATIARWVESGAPEGDPRDLPPPRKWPIEDGWQLARQFGEPDLVLKSEPFTMPAQGQDVWWKPATPIQLSEARWVRAVEMRPGTTAGRRIVHHALARLDQDEPDDLPPGLLMEWAVGKQYDVYRPNTGKLVLPGSQIRWDIHLHAVGESIRDHVELGVYFYPKGEVPKYRTRLSLFGTIAGDSIDIPPHSIAQSETFQVLRAPARLENFQPHMHLRGKAMKLDAILPDGTMRTLSYVGNFNFNWMNNYIYAEEDAPVLPKGTVIRMTAWHDNTTANPNNPDPDQWVGFGDRTVDEMAHAWVNVTYISEEDYRQWAQKHAAVSKR